jgi:hypothetical protein
VAPDAGSDRIPGEMNPTTWMEAHTIRQGRWTLLWLTHPPESGMSCHPLPVRGNPLAAGHETLARVPSAVSRMTQADPHAGRLSRRIGEINGVILSILLDRAFMFGTAKCKALDMQGLVSRHAHVSMGVEFLHGMLSALVEEVRQLRESMQALEHRLGETGSMPAPSVTGNTATVSVDGDLPAASMKAQSMSRQTLAAEDTRKSVDVSGRWRERTFTFDPAKHQWGELCHKGHDRDGGQSVREQANNECVDCRWERSTAYKARQRAVKREGQPVGG